MVEAEHVLGQYVLDKQPYFLELNGVVLVMMLPIL